MKVQTVLGPIKPSELGRTLTHEHFFMEFDTFYYAAPTHLQGYLNTKKIALETVGFLKQYPYASRFNLDLTDSESMKSVLEDVSLYKKWGGGTIVENSSHGLKRNLPFLYEISKQTNVHVVSGTGHYVQDVQPADALNLSVEQMTELYRNEMVDGNKVKIDDKETVIKCGFIGEVGSVWPITDFEKRSIQATGIVQEQLNCPVSFHPGRNSKAPFEIVRLYLEAGGKADKCVMSHLDRTIEDAETLLQFAELGVYCQFDLFGIECSYYQFNETFDMPSDGQRMNKIVELVKAGYENKILMSHDIHTKHRLINFGGHGYGHIINNILPRLLKKGLTAEQCDKISIKNPADWLQYNF